MVVFNQFTNFSTTLKHLNTLYSNIYMLDTCYNRMLMLGMLTCKTYTNNKRHKVYGSLAILKVLLSISTYIQ